MNNSSGIFCIVEAIFLIAAYVIGKFVHTNPNINQKTIDQISQKIYLITNYAEAFIIWAKQFMNKASGPEKMDAVVEKLKEVAERYDLDISEDEIRAIAQRTYDTVKKENQ